MAVAPQHDLLVRHFVAWADKKGRTPDRALLGELLWLRESYDELEPTYWPPGSVEHLLLDRWPSKGSTTLPDPDVLVETLDAFVRFLRSTGRMSARSGTPADLAKEARRAAGQMSEVAADPVHWSPGKVLLDFGRQRGIDLDDAADEAEAAERLEQIQDLWNSLPVEERRRRMPRLVDAVDEDLSEEQRAKREFGVDDGLIALLLSYNGRLPEGELPADEEVAPYFREAPFLHKVRALAEWVGPGRELTTTGVLRPALAREAYAELGLGSWQRDQLERRYPDERFAGVAKVGRENWLRQELERPWRSAADCEELHRLWRGAVGCGAIRVEGKRAIGEVEPEPDAERWVQLGVRAAVAVLDEYLDRPFQATRLVRAMLESYVSGCGPVSKEAVADWSGRWSFRPSDLAFFAGHRERSLTQWEEPTVAAAIGLLGDAGLYVETDESIALTPAGAVFVTAWLQHMEAMR